MSCIKYGSENSNEGKPHSRRNYFKYQQTRLPKPEQTISKDEGNTAHSEQTELRTKVILLIH